MTQQAIGARDLELKDDLESDVRARSATFLCGERRLKFCPREVSDESSRRSGARG
jgi:hypothetical protein